MAEIADVLIIGGGIAGTSLAARLAGKARVTLAEAQQHLGTQSTGRSAALLVEAYGPPEIRLLTGMSRAFFEAPPEGLGDAALAWRRGVLVYGAEGQLTRLREEFDLARSSAEVVWLDAGEVLRTCPILRPGMAIAGFLEPGALDLDADGLLQGFAQAAQRAGARLRKSAPVRRIERRSGGWLVEAGDAEIACGVLVDAAGAWADEIAERAGVPRCGLQPMRRSAATLPVPADIEALLPTLPFVAPVEEDFYFKPEARSIMVSLADETPSDPCDAFADDFDVATALERFHAATIVPEARPTAAWAGLRTFAPDRVPVIGFDPAAPNFFWCAGQGGYGIQTAPALSALAAKLILGEGLDGREASLAEAFRPERFYVD